MINLLQQSWALFLVHKRVLLWDTLIFLVAQNLFSYLANFSRVALISYLLVAIGWLVNTVVAVGFYQIVLNITAGRSVKVMDIFQVEILTLLRFIGLTIVGLVAGGLMMVVLFTGLTFISVPLALVASFVLVIIIGLFLLIRFGLAYFVLLDKKTGVFESLTISWVISRGDVWFLTKIILIDIGLVVVGLVALLVGLFVAIPMCLLLTTLAYRQLAAKEMPVITA